MTPTDPHGRQPELPLALSEPAPAPWWVSIIEYEIEGSQDAGWWDV